MHACILHDHEFLSIPYLDFLNHYVRSYEKKLRVLRDNPSMYGLLNEFIIPNIQQHEPLLRELIRKNFPLKLFSSIIFSRSF